MSDFEIKTRVRDHRKESRLWFKLFDEYLIWILLLLSLGFPAIFLKQFLSAQNILNLMSNSAILGLMVIAESLCLIVGKFDLSIESTLGFAVAAGAVLTTDYGLNPPVTWVIILISGASIGLFNGIMIEKLKINAFIQTLAMLLIIRGVVVYMIGGRYITDFHYLLRIFGGPKIWVVPISVIIMIFFYGIFVFLTKNMIWGRKLYAAGSNPQAAYISGINVEKVNITVFSLAGLIAAFAGLVFLGRQNAATWVMGQGMIFEILAAAVIGGISLSGGKGNLIGALGGVIFLGLIRSILTWFNLSVYVIDAARGLLILFAITVDAIKRKIVYFSEK
jgi:ribose/xylose/arabinose/galactoside ABC-type transport system permease subunit